jgi:hypothetical protein
MFIAPASGYTTVEEEWQERKKIVFHYWLSSIIRRDAVIWGDHNKMEVLRSFSRSRGS